MTVKKKSVKTPNPEEDEKAVQEPQEDRVTVVTEVVEVVEGSERSADVSSPKPAIPPAESVETPADDDNGETQEFKETGTGTQTSSEDKEDAVPEGEERVEEKRKEAVEELFKPERGHALPEISVHTRESSRTLVVWAVIVTVSALVIGGGLLAAVRRPFSLPMIFAKPTPTLTPTPIPTPQPVDRETLSIQVLNGGGTPGAAGKMKQLLEEKGYQVGDVGNTDEYAYETTEILVKPSKEAALTLLQADLGETYTLGTVSATLPDDASYDARVIVGKQ